MRELYERIANLSADEEAFLLTGLSGEAFGRKALISGGNFLWESHPGGFFASCSDVAGSLSGSGIRDVSGMPVFFEYLGSQPKLVICGGGHVSIPIIKIGIMTGFFVTVLEDRPQFADNARRAGASRVICEPFAEALERLDGDLDTYFVIVTRGHRYDQECLERIAAKKSAYIGMMGSRRRVALVKEHLLERGCSPEVLERLCAPIGLDIGSETPEEIAVSIMAEIIQVKNRRARAGGFPGEILEAIGSPDFPGAVLATIVRKKGSAPREAGTKMLIFPDGRTIGTVGGGCAEAEVLRRGLYMLRSDRKTPELCQVNMTGEEAAEEGMVCGGCVDILLERIENRETDGVEDYR